MEAVLRRFAEISEYRVTVDESRTLPELKIEIECASPQSAADVVERVDHAIREELLFRADVRVVEPGSLPRFDMKARRFIRKQSVASGP